MTTVSTSVDERLGRTEARLDPCYMRHLRQPKRISLIFEPTSARTCSG